MKETYTTTPPPPPPQNLHAYTRYINLKENLKNMKVMKFLKSQVYKLDVYKSRSKTKVDNKSRKYVMKQ